MARDNDYVIVGSPWDAEKGIQAGAAYVYRRTGFRTWDAGFKLMGSDSDANDYFGVTVDISGDFAIVGAYGK